MGLGRGNRFTHPRLEISYWISPVFKRVIPPQSRKRSAITFQLSSLSIKRIQSVSRNSSTCIKIAFVRRLNAGAFNCSCRRLMGQVSFKKSFGRSTFTYEGFSTVLIQIESILYSRPLCPVNFTSDQLIPFTRLKIIPEAIV